MSEEVGAVFVLIAQPAFVAAEGHLDPVALALGDAVGRRVFVADLERGALIPEWAGDHIGHTVPVDVAKTRTLGPELVAQFLLCKRMKTRRGGPGMQRSAPRRKQSCGSGDQQKSDGVRSEAEVHTILVAAD